MKSIPMMEAGLLIGGIAAGAKGRVSIDQDTVLASDWIEEGGKEFVEAHHYKRVQLTFPGHIRADVALFVPAYIPETERLLFCIKELRETYEAHLAFMNLEKPLP